MQLVAHVPRGEPVQRPARRSAEERDEPVGDRRDEDGEAPEHEPDEMRDREQEPEEDGHP